jgi:hypothetical protein
LFEELIIRFLAGGIAVSFFSVLGDVLTPKSFAGLFGAAPSVALATLILTIHKSGVSFARMEARSMIAGGIAFLVYAYAVSWLLSRRTVRVLPTAAGLLVGWLAVAITIWSVSVI